MQDRPLPVRVAHPRHGLLDRIFLEALARTPEPEELFRAAARVNGDVFARFMTDHSTLADEAEMIAALPLAPMTRAALAAAASPRAVRGLRARR